MADNKFIEGVVNMSKKELNKVKSKFKHYQDIKQVQELRTGIYKAKSAAWDILKGV